MTNKPIWPWIEKPRNKFIIFLILTISMVVLTVNLFLNDKKILGVFIMFITLIDTMITYGQYLKWKNKF